MHRYRGSRPWSVVVLAGGAALGAVLLTGGVSSAVRAGAGTEGIQLSPGAAQTIATAQAKLATAVSHLASRSLSRSEGWQVQVGSFQRRESAEAQLRRLAEKVPGLAGLTPSAEPFGALTRARFGGLSEEAAARRLCVRIVQEGSECLAVRPGS